MLAPHQMYFFREKKSVCTFFRPIGATVDLENPEKMRLLSLSEVSIQPRTSPPKFLKNRGVRMGVSGVMQQRRLTVADCGADGS